MKFDEVGAVTQVKLIVESSCKAQNFSSMSFYKDRCCDTKCVFFCCVVYLLALFPVLCSNTAHTHRDTSCNFQGPSDTSLKVLT